MKVVGLGGSLHANSTSLAALKIALQGAADAGAEVELFDVRALNLPFYSTELMSIPPAADQYVEAMHEADGLLWSSPLYHGTVSGVFKNAIDWLDLLANSDPPYLTDKVIGLISTAGGMQGLQAVNTMEFSVRSLRAWAVPLVLPIARASEAFDSAGHPRNETLAADLRFLGREVVRAAHQFADQGYCDYSTPYVGKGRVKN